MKSLSTPSIISFFKLRNDANSAGYTYLSDIMSEYRVNEPILKT